jgi:RimJ/RimL family protein N-acetyltransferase
MRTAIDKRLASHAKGVALPFAVIAKESGKAVGMTNYLNVDPKTRRLEIGGTWYRKSVQRTRTNTECKKLLLSHAFDELDCVAVKFRTHFLNRPSRRAIERLGAKLDGVLRNHQLARNGTLKDMCVYSIISAEWPAVSAQLNWLLEGPHTAES